MRIRVKSGHKVAGTVKRARLVISPTIVRLARGRGDAARAASRPRRSPLRSVWLGEHNIRADDLRGSWRVRRLGFSGLSVMFIRSAARQAAHDFVVASGAMEPIDVARLIVNACWGDNELGGDGSRSCCGSLMIGLCHEWHQAAPQGVEVGCHAGAFRSHPRGNAQRVRAGSTTPSTARRPHRTTADARSRQA